MAIVSDDPPPPSLADAPPDDDAARPHGNGSNGTVPLRPAPRAPRIPPHDLGAEAALLGACLLSSDAIAAAVSAGIGRADFYKPAHGHIYDACAALHARDQPADPVTVADELHRDGLLEQIGGAPTLVELQTGTPAISNAHRYARIVAEMSQLRALIGVAGQIADLGYSLREDVGEVTARAMDLVRVVAERRISNEGRSIVTDMQAVLDGEADVVLPNLAPRDDRATCLLYGPGINWLDGEPGRGKSMLAMWWAYRELDAGRDVVYIQFEGEGNRTQIGARLAQMGLTDATHLHYIHRSGPWSPSELAELRQLLADRKPSLVVVDSVASAMQAEGLDPESNRDVEAWKAAIPSWSTAVGAAFLAVDHLTKNPETRGRYSIGAQRKLGITDVAYRLLMHQEAGLGSTGYGKLEVMKDREGALGVFQEGRVIAEVSIASEKRGDSYDLRVGLAAPASATGSAAHGPSWYMERVSMELEAHGPLGKVELRTRVGKRKDQVDLAIERLLDEGAIEPEKVPGRAKPYRSVFPWHAPQRPPVRSFYEAGSGDDEGEPF